MVIVKHFDIRWLIAENKFFFNLFMGMPKLDRLFYKFMISLPRRSQTVLKVTEKQWNLHAAKCFVVLCMQMM
jgi:hypothetical protein